MQKARHATLHLTLSWAREQLIAFLLHECPEHEKTFSKLQCELFIGRLANSQLLYPRNVTLKAVAPRRASDP